MVSNFQLKVYGLAKKIPRGKVATYKQIAEAIGRPKAIRTVGNVLNKNTNPKVPCHRVIKSNGEVGGFRKGVQKKINILTHEGVKMENKRVNLKNYLWRA